MDLPPDKLKIFKQLPNEKKIQFIKSLVRRGRHIEDLIYIETFF